MRQASPRRLRKGCTLFDVLDGIESAVVAYMAGRRGITEQQMRDLLNKDAEARASWMRKVRRGMDSTGLDPAKLVGR